VSLRQVACVPESDPSRDAFDPERFREQLRSLARARLDPRLWSRVDPSEVAQEALLKAHAARDQFRGRTEWELIAWLKAILNHTLANALRTNDRRHGLASVSLSDLSEGSSAQVAVLPADAGRRPEELAAHNEQLVRLAEALQTLPDDQRAVVEMKHFHGLTVAEICVRTGRTRAAVAGLLFRGLKALRGLLDDPGDAAREAPQ
jgi:RNA polymerase sigma-70 factor (ECF subfamily)